MRVWRVIENDPYVPRKTVDGVQVPKDQSEWTKEDDQKVEINYMAINYLLVVVNTEEFKKLSRCQNFPSK